MLLSDIAAQVSAPHGQTIVHLATSSDPTTPTVVGLIPSGLLNT